MSLSDAIAVIQTIIAVGAFIFAYAEFKKWRTELLGSKKIELALKLGKAAIEVREAFNRARSPHSSIAVNPQGLEYQLYSTPDEKFQRDREYSFNQQLQHIQSKLGLLDEVMWEVSILFPMTDNVEGQVKFFNAKFLELWGAMQVMSKNFDHLSPGFKVLYWQGEEDEFARAINENTNKLLELARKYTK